MCVEFAAACATVPRAARGITHLAGQHLRIGRADSCPDGSAFLHVGFPRTRPPVPHPHVELANAEEAVK